MNPVFTTSRSTIPSVKAKKFTAEEVTLIVAMLGEPPYREETLSYPLKGGLTKRHNLCLKSIVKISIVK